MAPAELEGVILTHPSVADAAVVGVPDERTGELPRAYVVLKKGMSATEEELHTHVNGELTKHQAQNIVRCFI